MTRNLGVDKEAVRRLNQQGFNNRQIAAHFKCSPQSIDYIVKKQRAAMDNGPSGIGARDGTPKPTLQLNNLVSNSPLDNRMNWPIRRETRTPWWHKYTVTHDDGAKLIMTTLPRTVLCFGDMQANYQHIDTIPFLKAVLAYYKPDACICMGDEADLTGFKKHFMNAESLGPAQELEQAIAFMQEVFKIIPECIVLSSNHVADRISYAQSQGNIPNVLMRRWAEIINAPVGWVWRDYVIWGRWLMEHGHKIAKGSRPNLLEGITKRFNRHLSIMRGHFHSELGEHIKPVWMPGFWQARQCFTGCLMDYTKAGYTRDALMVGCVVLIDGVPKAIPMARNESNRWTGELVQG